MLALDETTVWGVRRGGGKGQKQNYTVFATPRPGPTDEGSTLPDFVSRPSSSGGGGSWTAGLPLRPRAMVRADRHLFIGGMPGRVDPKDLSAPGNAASEGPKGGLLHVVSCNDGRTLARVKLDSPPVWDGMAAAAGRLYLADRDGRVVCMAEAKPE